MAGQSCQPARRSQSGCTRGNGILELVFPTLNFRLRPEMLRAGLVAPLHPDAGKGRVEKKIVGAQSVSALGRRERGVEASQGKVYFGQGMPGLESIGSGGRRLPEFGQRRLALTEGVIRRRFLDQGLEFVRGHAAKKK